MRQNTLPCRQRSVQFHQIPQDSVHFLHARTFPFLTFSSSVLQENHKILGFPQPLEKSLRHSCCFSWGTDRSTVSFWSRAASAYAAFTRSMPQFCHFLLELFQRSPLPPVVNLQGAMPTRSRVRRSPWQNRELPIQRTFFFYCGFPPSKIRYGSQGSLWSNRFPSGCSSSAPPGKVEKPFHFHGFQSPNCQSVLSVSPKPCWMASIPFLDRECHLPRITASALL